MSPTSSAATSKTKRKDNQTTQNGRQRTYMVFAASIFRHPSPEGAIAQLGERLNGIQEVGGSTPPGSTNFQIHFPDIV